MVNDSKLWSRNSLDVFGPAPQIHQGAYRIAAYVTNKKEEMIALVLGILEIHCVSPE